ncbi:hypothetical protein [Niveibacterium terrae]|uniref:hypothetical protein n=1 Tax=Niveibacterium terrae TaxID=3373598 RepID=UPI003A93724C
MAKLIIADLVGTQYFCYIADKLQFASPEHPHLSIVQIFKDRCLSALLQRNVVCVAARGEIMSEPNHSVKRFVFYFVFNFANPKVSTKPKTGKPFNPCR